MRQNSKENENTKLANVLVNICKKTDLRKIKGKKNHRYVNFLVKEALQSNMFYPLKAGLNVTKNNKRNKSMKRKSVSRSNSKKNKIEEKIEEKPNKEVIKEDIKVEKEHIIIPRAESITEIKLLTRKRGRKKTKNEEMDEIMNTLDIFGEEKKTKSRKRVNSVQKYNSKIHLNLDDKPDFSEKKKKRAKTKERKIIRKEKFLEIEGYTNGESQNSSDQKDGQLKNLLIKGQNNSSKKVTFAEGTVFINHNDVKSNKKGRRKRKKNVQKKKEEVCQNDCNNEEIDINQEVELIIKKEIQKTEKNQLKLNGSRKRRKSKRGKRKRGEDIETPETSGNSVEIELVEDNSEKKEEKTIYEDLNEYMKKSIKLIEDCINPKLKEYYNKEKKINMDMAISLKKAINNAHEKNKKDISIPLRFEGHNIVGTFNLALNCKKIEEYS